MKQVQKPRKPLIVYYLIAIAVLILFNSFVFPAIVGGNVEEVDYGTFLTMVENKEVSKVQLEGESIYFTDKSEDSRQYETTRFDDPDLVNRLEKAGCKFGRVADRQMSPFLSMLLSIVIPMIIFILLGQFLSRQLMKKMGGAAGGNQFMQFGKSNAKVYVQSTTGITFNDVAGEDEAKELLTEIVDFLHNPQKYQEIGAVCPKGALLVGPPGTGKTLLAKAVAGEAGVPFFSISGSEFVEMFVGMGASKVRDLFKQANEKAPCIVFIDEIDTIGKKRDSHGMAGNDEREQTLNQLLTEMDGFDASKGVVILAATNRPDTLDPALLRPGRFDRRIPVELPDLKGREEILKVHARKIKLGDNVDFNAIARAASGASGAELANMVNEAALRAVRENRKFVVQSDLEESIEVVIAGYQKKNRVLSTKEKVIEQERISAAPFCEKLNIPGNSEVFHLCRVMYLDKEPLFIDSSWIPLSRYPDFDEIYVEGSSTYQLFQERFDTRVVSDKKTIDIFAATRPQAKWLKCELGEPLFRISKIAFDQNDKPVHVSELFCRANRITLTIDNKRH